METKYFFDSEDVAVELFVRIMALAEYLERKGMDKANARFAAYETVFYLRPLLTAPAPEPVKMSPDLWAKAMKEVAEREKKDMQDGRDVPA